MQQCSSARSLDLSFVTAPRAQASTLEKQNKRAQLIRDKMVLAERNTTDVVRNGRRSRGPSPNTHTSGGGGGGGGVPNSGSLSGSGGGAGGGGNSGNASSNDKAAAAVPGAGTPESSDDDNCKWTDT